MKTKIANKPKNKNKRHSSSTSRRRKQRVQTKLTIRKNRPLHRKILLHPSFVFFLLCFGVFVISWTYSVLAQSISSIIEAPALESAATISSPLNQATITNMQTVVNGYCPNNSYIILKLNGSFDGVAWCASDNTYSIDTDLYSGDNILSVQDYNTTDLVGPPTPQVTVYYKPPVAYSSPSLSSTSSVSVVRQSTTKASPISSNETVAKPILLTSNFQFKSFSVSRNFSWQLDAEGGISPYYINIGWGDGTKSNLYFKTDPVFTINHSYKKPGYYAVVVALRDSTKQTKIIQLAALISSAGGQTNFTTTPSSQTTGTSIIGNIKSSAKHFLILVWVPYITVLLMVLSFWLGERRDQVLKPAHSRARK